LGVNGREHSPSRGWNPPMGVGIDFMLAGKVGSRIPLNIHGFILEILGVKKFGTHPFHSTVIPKLGPFHVTRD